MGPLPAPALNKWTKLGPTIAKVVFMSQFCGVLGYCLRREFGKLEERDEEEQEDAGGADADAAAAAAAVGLPLDERAEWRRVANQRRLKTVEFLEDREAAFFNLLWLVIAAPILTLHWRLFKHAKWVSERAADTEAGHIVSRFCNPASNPAAAIIVTLLNILVNVEALEVVCFFHGPLQQWSISRQLAVQQLVLVAAGQLWRKLVAPWLCYPWRMWPLAFSANEQERRQAARELLAQRDCCLDECFSRKLRALAPDEDALLEMHAFLHTCFTRVVATSTFVERRFAAYGAWCSRRGGTPRLATLAAKHLTSCLKDFVEHWRGQQEGRKKDSAKQRPSWVADRGTQFRQTGLHVFISERGHDVGQTLSGGEARSLSVFLQETRRKWREELSAEDRARYSRRARERNLLAVAEQQAQNDASELHGGPWRVASLNDRWPLRTELLAEATQATKRREMVQSWKSGYSEPEEELPNTSLPGEKDVHLFGACPQGGCEACLSAPQQLALRRLQLNLATLVRYGYPQPGKLDSGPLLLRLCSAGGGRRTTKFVVVCFATRTNPPESVLLELTAPGHAASRLPHALFLPNPVAAGHFCSDTVLSVGLVQRATEWTFGVLRLGDPGGNLDRFVISGGESFSQEDLEQKRQEIMLQEAALRAAKSANKKRSERSRTRRKTDGAKPPRAKSAGQMRKGKGPKRKRSQTGRDVATDGEGPASAAATDDDGDASSGESSATWSDMDSESDTAVRAPLSESTRAEGNRPETGSAASSTPTGRAVAEEGDAAPQAAGRGPGGSLPGRKLQQRAEPWGPFSISKIVRSRDGQTTGWGAICGLHSDHGVEGESASRTQCKKAFSCGSRSREECVLLLKRWLLMGLMEQDDWPAHKRRTSHLHLPLDRLQEGPSEAEMDEWMQNFMQRAEAAGGTG